ncbi:MAG: hypothetical protein ACRD2C_00495 [Acidimicrobiales bacterium]
MPHSLDSHTPGGRARLELGENVTVRVVAADPTRPKVVLEPV